MTIREAFDKRMLYLCREVDHPGELHGHVFAPSPEEAGACYADNEFRQQSPSRISIERVLRLGSGISELTETVGTYYPMEETRWVPAVATANQSQTRVSAL